MTAIILCTNATSNEHSKLALRPVWHERIRSAPCSLLHNDSHKAYWIRDTGGLQEPLLKYSWRLDTHLLGHHDLDELLIVDLSVAVNVSLAQHLIDLLVSQLLTEVRHDMAKLSSRDETVAVLIENTESLLQLLLRVSVLHLASHQRAELREVNGSVAVSINLVDHVNELSLSWVLAKRAHDGAELLGGNRTITVLVEQGERLLELSDLLLSQLRLVRHVPLCVWWDTAAEQVCRRQCGVACAR
mmetsp:Transcript_5947/g.11629  ORF Transcript_5947/g.11629 Transcript_5947/m.11629 type:complete len:244 (-) Transcript_5947:7-738(-)